MTQGWGSPLHERGVRGLYEVPLMRRAPQIAAATPHVLEKERVPNGKRTEEEEEAMGPPRLDLATPLDLADSVQRTDMAGPVFKGNSGCWGWVEERLLRSGQVLF